MALRAEARSVNHFKEVSYKLENKVVELTQSITTLKGEKKSMADRAVQLEAQIRTWMEKYEKMEKKAKGLEDKLQEPTVPREKWDELQAERNSLYEKYQTSLEDLKARDKDIASLNEQLAASKQENERLQKSLAEATERAVDESEIGELRSQIAALKAQLTQAMRAPRRQDSSNNVRSLSPAPNGTRNASPSPSKALDLKEGGSTQRARSPTGKLVNRKARRNSADAPNLRSRPIEAIQQAEMLHKNPRPTSIAHSSALYGSKSSSIIPGSVIEDPEEEVMDRIMQVYRMPLLIFH